MKKIFGVFVAVLLLCVPVLSQETSGQWSVGVGLETGVPTGDFNTGYSFGIGGLANLRYVIDQNLSFGVKAGYMTFSAKEIAGLTGNNINVIPILVGAQYFLTPPMETTSMRVYAAGDLGLFMLSNGNSESKFGFAPILGAQFKAGDKMYVDVHANYTIIPADPSAFSWVSAGIGLEFDM
jgi:opacity protein-like surface antigen